MQCEDAIKEILLCVQPLIKDHILSKNEDDVEFLEHLVFNLIHLEQTYSSFHQLLIVCELKSRIIAGASKYEISQFFDEIEAAVRKLSEFRMGWIAPNRSASSSSSSFHPNLNQLVRFESKSAPTSSPSTPGQLFLSSQSLIFQLQSTKDINSKLSLLKMLYEMPVVDLMGFDDWKDIREPLIACLNDNELVIPALQLLQRLFIHAVGSSDNTEQAAQMHISLTSFVLQQHALNQVRDTSSHDYIVYVIRVLNSWQIQLPSIYRSLDNSSWSVIFQMTMSLLSREGNIDVSLMFARVDPKAIWFSRWMMCHSWRAPIIDCILKLNIIPQFIFSVSHNLSFKEPDLARSVQEFGILGTLIMYRIGRTAFNQSVAQSDHNVPEKCLDDSSEISSIDDCCASHRFLCLSCELLFSLASLDLDISDVILATECLRDFLLYIFKNILDFVRPIISILSRISSGIFSAELWVKLAVCNAPLNPYLRTIFDLIDLLPDYNAISSLIELIRIPGICWHSFERLLRVICKFAKPPNDSDFLIFLHSILEDPTPLMCECFSFKSEIKYSILDCLSILCSNQEGIQSLDKHSLLFDVVSHLLHLHKNSRLSDFQINFIQLSLSKSGFNMLIETKWIEYLVSIVQTRLEEDLDLALILSDPKMRLDPPFRALVCLVLSPYFFKSKVIIEFIVDNIRCTRHQESHLFALILLRTCCFRLNSFALLDSEYNICKILSSQQCFINSNLIIDPCALIRVKLLERRVLNVSSMRDTIFFHCSLIDKHFDSHIALLSSIFQRSEYPLSLNQYSLIRSFCGGFISHDKSFLDIIVELSESSSIFDWHSSLLVFLCGRNCLELLLSMGPSPINRHIEHKIEFIIANELPLTFHAFQSNGLSIKLLCNVFLDQCFYGVLESSQIANFLIIPLIFGYDYSAYFCVSVFRHLESLTLKYASQGILCKLFIEPIDDYDCQLIDDYDCQNEMEYMHYLKSKFSP